MPIYLVVISSHEISYNVDKLKRVKLRLCRYRVCVEVRTLVEGALEFTKYQTSATHGKQHNGNLCFELFQSNGVK